MTPLREAVPLQQPIAPARGQRHPAWQSAEDPLAPRWLGQVDPIALTTEDGF